jgi:hypothetical protein
LAFSDKAQVIAVLFQCNTFVDHKSIISYMAGANEIGVADNVMEAANGAMIWHDDAHLIPRRAI